jgi:hypothetical protein
VEWHQVEWRCLDQMGDRARFLEVVREGQVKMKVQEAVCLVLGVAEVWNVVMILAKGKGAGDQGSGLLLLSRYQGLLETNGTIRG